MWLERVDLVPNALRQDERIARVMERLRGPWAFALLDRTSQQLWFGRDYFGRRSLLVGTAHQRSGARSSARLMLASVLNNELKGECDEWREVPATGVFRLCLREFQSTAADELVAAVEEDASVCGRSDDSTSKVGPSSTSKNLLIFLRA